MRRFWLSFNATWPRYRMAYSLKNKEAETKKIQTSFSFCCETKPIDVLAANTQVSVRTTVAWNLHLKKAN